MEKSKRPLIKKRRRRPFRKKKQSFRRRRPSIPPGQIDFTNTSLLNQFISQQGKILSRRVTRLTLKQQRLMTIAIKQARILALLPFVSDETKFRKKQKKEFRKKQKKQFPRKQKKEFPRTKSNDRTTDLRTRKK